MKPSHRIRLLVILMAPLLLVRVNAYHDWGDDFAQYLLQAQWLGGVIETLPVSDTFFHGPQVKGLLFSLMLVPLVYIPVPLILLGKILVALGLGLMGVLLFYRIRPMMPFLPALTLVLVFLWHPAMLKLKDQVLPDFIFGALTLAAMVLWDRNKRGDRHMALLIASLSFGLKSAGVVLIAAMAISLILHPPVSEKRFRSWVALIFPALAIAVFEILLSGQKHSTLWYSFVTINEWGSHRLTEHADTYRRALMMLFETEAPAMVNLIIPWLIVPATLGGFVMMLWKRKGIALLFVPLYLLMLLLYPYDRDPVRFLVPVLPWMLVFACVFYSKILSFLNETYQPILITGITLILALPFLNTTRLELAGNVVYEPWSPESRSMLEFLRNDVPKDMIIADIYPWSLAWCTGVRTVPVTASYKAEIMIIRTSNFQFHRFGGPSGAELMYSNLNFKVLRINSK